MNRLAFRIALVVGITASWLLTTAEVWPSR